MHTYNGPVPAAVYAPTPKRRYVRDDSQGARCPRCQSPLIATARGWKCGCNA